MGWSGQWGRVCQGEECVRAELEASEIVARVDQDVPRDMGTGPQDNTAWELGEAARGGVAEVYAHMFACIRGRL